MTDLFEGLKIETITEDDARRRLGDEYEAKERELSRRIQGIDELVSRLGRDQDLLEAFERQPFLTLAERELVGPFDQITLMRGGTSLMEPPAPFRAYRECVWLLDHQVVWLCITAPGGNICRPEPQIVWQWVRVCRWAHDSRTGG